MVSLVLCGVKGGYNLKCQPDPEGVGEREGTTSELSTYCVPGTQCALSQSSPTPRPGLPASGRLTASLLVVPGVGNGAEQLGLAHVVIAGL